jgi:hypothetical protein
MDENHVDTQNNAGRTRTYSANSARDVYSKNGVAAPRGVHYRSGSSSRLREAAVDPLLMVSLERPDLEDEAETVSFTLV